MYVDAGHVVTSPSDLSTWAACEWAFLRRLDAKLGRIDRAEDKADAMLERTATLGIEHEERYLERLRAEHGAENIVEFADRPAPADYASAAKVAVYDDPAWYGGSGSTFENTVGAQLGLVQQLAGTPQGALSAIKDQLKVYLNTPSPL